MLTCVQESGSPPPGTPRVPWDALSPPSPPGLLSPCLGVNQGTCVFSLSLRLALGPTLSHRSHSQRGMTSYLDAISLLLSVTHFLTFTHFQYELVLLCPKGKDLQYTGHPEGRGGDQGTGVRGALGHLVHSSGRSSPAQLPSPRCSPDPSSQSWVLRCYQQFGECSDFCFKTVFCCFSLLFFKRLGSCNLVSF